MYYWYDYTYILVVIGAILCLIASARVNVTYKRYSKIKSMSGMTGAEAARKILHDAGIYDVTVGRVSGKLTDHYDPTKKELNLSEGVYSKNSVAAIGVAAHECGHAIQHQQEYFPLRFRGALVPVVNFGSWASWPLIIIGLFFGSHTGSVLIQLGILFFSLAVLFQLVTLPVEINASNRAVHILGSTGMLQDDELRKTRKVLRAAALTYVASAAAAILELLRLVLLVGRRD